MQNSRRVTKSRPVCVGLYTRENKSRFIQDANTVV